METGKIVELVAERSSAVLETATGGRHFPFSVDQMIGGQGGFNQLRIGMQVYFEREEAHGPSPHPLRVRINLPAAPPAVALEAAAEHQGIERLATE